MPIDLHLHSTYSDGYFKPAEVVRKAARANLKAVALTDHDTCRGVPEARRAGSRYGVWVIPAVELSADVMEKGMIISGGTSQLRNLPELFSEATGVPAMMADEPALCVAKGTGVALENLESYKRSILASK